MLKATGIVRRIDDLGRVVIPKEIRRTLRIREGEQLEIFTGKDCEVVLKKYSPLGEFGKMASELCFSFGQNSNTLVCISDKDQIIATSSKKDDLKGKAVTKELEKVINDRKIFFAKKDDSNFVNIFEEKSEYQNQLIKPILTEGDAIGAVMIFSKEKISNEDEKNANIITLFYEKLLEN